MICIRVQAPRLDKLERSDPPDYNPRSSSSPSRSRAAGLGVEEMAEVVSNLPQPSSYADMGHFSAPPWVLQSWSSSPSQYLDEEFLGAAIGQKRSRTEGEFAGGSSSYTPGSSVTTYSGPSVKVSRDLSGSRSVDTVTTSRAAAGGDADDSYAPLGEIVKKAMERSSPRAFSSSPSYSAHEYSSDSGKHSDISKHFSPPPSEGTIHNSRTVHFLPVM